jgi:hypothetical protein
MQKIGGCGVMVGCLWCLSPRLIVSRTSGPMLISNKRHMEVKASFHNDQYCQIGRIVMNLFFWSVEILHWWRHTSGDLLGGTTMHTLSCGDTLSGGDASRWRTHLLLSTGLFGPDRSQQQAGQACSQTAPQSIGMYDLHLENGDCRPSACETAATT